MSHSIRKAAMFVAALAALALGGSALAGAASKSKSAGTTSSPSTTSPSAKPGRDRTPLSADVAAKVKAAALAKVPGATVLSTESGGPYGSVYHAHIKTSGGTLQVVLVNSWFEATAVQADRGPGGRGGPGGRDGGKGRGGRGETPLTGDTKQKVEAAVLAKYPGATIERSETNGDSSAPYEAHIKTSDGKELEVHVSKDFAVVDAQAMGARP